jgi:hypothetical protein
MTVRKAKFDLAKLRAASVEAAKRVALWPTWKREVVKAVHDAALSEPREPKPDWVTR